MIASNIFLFKLLVLVAFVVLVSARPPKKQRRTVNDMRTVYNFTTATVLKDYGPKTLQKVRFLHLPKTGTTFAATIVHYCCEQLDDIFVDVLTRLNSDVPMPWKGDDSCSKRLIQPKSKNGNWWAHFPYRDEDSGYVVTILRTPLKRLASQLIHMRSLRGHMITFGVNSLDAELLGHTLQRRLDKALEMREKLTRQYSNDAYVLHELDIFYDKLQSCAKTDEYLPTPYSTINGNVSSCHWEVASYYPGMTNCQCKMVLGHSCSAKIDVNASMTEIAVSRLRKSFAFVGLQESWNATVDAFHRLYGGKLFAEELLVRRMQSMKKTKRVVEQAIRSNEERCDALLYQEAQNIFSTYAKSDFISETNNS